MQRLIVVGFVLMLLLGIGGGAGAYYYRQNRPMERWVPLPIPEVPLAKQQPLAAEIEKRLRVDSVLLAVAKDTRLAEQWKLPSDEAAAAEIGRRLFVRVGAMETPSMGVVNSINTGVTGKRKEMRAMDEVAKRIFEEIRKILGIKDPQ